MNRYDCDTARTQKIRFVHFLQIVLVWRAQLWRSLERFNRGNRYIYEFFPSPIRFRVNTDFCVGQKLQRVVKKVVSQYRYYGTCGTRSSFLSTFKYIFFSKSLPPEKYVSYSSGFIFRSLHLEFQTSRKSKDEN